MREVPEAQLRSLLDAAPDPTVIVDTQGEIVFASSQVRPVFGHDPDELSGQPIETLVPQRYRHLHRHHRHRYLEDPRVRPMGMGFDLYGRRKDGSEFPVEISLSPVETDSGLLILSTIRDITLRKQGEAALARERAFSNSLIETAPTIILLLDLEGRILTVNPYLEQLSGYRAEDVLGMDWFTIFVPEEDREEIWVLFRNVVREGSIAGHINPIRLRDGTLRHIQWHAKTLADPQGHTVGLLNVGHDVTERITYEEALKRAQEIAEQADRSKSRFLATASHDLRQPLQSIGLYLSVLSRQLDQPRQQEISGKIRQSLDTMGQLLNALLDISKLESGSVSPEKRDFPLTELVERIVTDNLPHAENKALTLEFRGEEPIVHSDPALLQRVIENLVSNAIRYTEEGAVMIECRCTEGTAHIEVADTGSGIPQDALEKIFEEYYQLENAARDRRKGLGLGLSIVRHIARLLDHPVHAESALGEGSTFRVEVPLGRAADRPAESGLRAVERRTGDERPLVLLVEDDPAVVDATQLLLESTGVRVETASNGDDALDRIRTGVCPDIVISDYRLTRYSGIEVIERVRTLVGEIPAVLMTGDTLSREVDRDSQSYEVLRKPVDTDQLLVLIESLMS